MVEMLTVIGRLFGTPISKISVVFIVKNWVRSSGARTLQRGYFSNKFANTFPLGFLRRQTQSECFALK